MTPGPRPPQLARRLLNHTLTPDARESIVGDLIEVFARDHRTCGAARARLRFWRKAASLSVGFLLERVRGRARAGVSWMDVKLGFRMMLRYPGLTAIAGLAMAFAIAIGAAAFEVKRSSRLSEHARRRIFRRRTSTSVPRFCRTRRSCRPFPSWARPCSARSTSSL